MNRLLTGICLAALLPVLLFPASVTLKSGHAELKDMSLTKFEFDISFPASVSKDAIDGRVLLLLSNNNEKEPRYQISEDLSTQQVFGVGVDGLQPGQNAVVDASAVGYPRRNLSDVPPGEYWVQALLHRYETFHRADGHSVKLPMDRGEGQQWSRAPGNLYSTPQKIKVDPNASSTIKISLGQMSPPIDPPKDTKYVKHIRIQSKLQTKL